MQSDKIYIDFQGGAHGNYLEFVCNRFLAQIPTASPTPFNDLGASHRKEYLSEPKFIANHFTPYGIVLDTATVIVVHIEVNDLLPLQCVSLLRAGDYHIRPDQLEIGTYHKLNNQDYRSALDNLLANFFAPHYFIDAYHVIADPTWPRVTNLSEYQSLPQHIRYECETQHGFKWLKLDEQNPNCPRSILKEFFEIGFRYPEKSGFMVGQNKNIHTRCTTHHFPFSAFYDSDLFMKELAKIATLTATRLDVQHQDVYALHNEFLIRQPYKDAKKQCDDLVNRKRRETNFVLPYLDVIQEAYISSQLCPQS
jgi:hypothetical protein